VADKAQRLLEYERWEVEQESVKLRELGTTLTTATDVDALTRALARRLPTGVPGCRLVLYDDPTRGAAGGAGTARPVLSCEERALLDRDAGALGAPYPVRQLLPDELLPVGRRFTLVLEPLHVGDEHLGLALFDVGSPQDLPRPGALYGALGDQISAALKGIRLFDEVRRARDSAEQASRFKTRLLDNATDELRSPVEAILRLTRPPGGAASAPGTASAPAVGSATAPDTAPATALRCAHDAGARLLRLIDDLLDLSRAESDGLELSLRLLDPRPVLVKAFHDAFGTGSGSGTDVPRLHLPHRLPAVRADTDRLRQIVLNLLTAAAPARTPGRVLLTVGSHPTQLRIRIACPDRDLPSEDAEQLLEPFASGEPGTRLGPAIARRLAALHGGSVGPDTGPAHRGFRLDLPLPTPAEPPHPSTGRSRTLLVAGAGAPPPEIDHMLRQRGLLMHRLCPDDDLTALVAEHPPLAIAYDAVGAQPQDWYALQRLHDHPALRRTPFLLYGPVSGDDLAQGVQALRPSGPTEPVVIADHSARSRERLRRIVAHALPGRAVRTAADGTTALAVLAEAAPCLVVVARTLPDMGGFDVIERMRTRKGHERVPALVLGDRGFTAADARRAEPYPGLVLLGRDILSDAETARLLAAMTRRTRQGAQHTDAPVHAALAYLEQHYRLQISRWQVAEAAGVSEDHLSRLFHRQLGLSLWDYLIRLRIERAKERLRQSDDSVQTVARAVGFHDRAYFSRVFRKVTGLAPHAYRKSSARA
jgi:AraC-like DNA-binding protein/signal transduction histidine kinase